MPGHVHHNMAGAFLCSLCPRWLGSCAFCYIETSTTKHLCSRGVSYSSNLALERERSYSSSRTTYRQYSFCMQMCNLAISVRNNGRNDGSENAQSIWRQHCIVFVLYERHLGRLCYSSRISNWHQSQQVTIRLSR